MFCFPFLLTMKITRRPIFAHFITDSIGYEYLLVENRLKLDTACADECYMAKTNCNISNLVIQCSLPLPTVADSCRLLLTLADSCRPFPIPLIRADIGISLEHKKNIKRSYKQPYCSMHSYFGALFCCCYIPPC